MALPRKKVPVGEASPRRASRAPVNAPQGAPAIRTLRPSACLALLKRHAVGRMAFSFRDRVDITPIHYVFADDWLFARTSDGAKMTTIRHSPWVAFEVDEVGGIFDWRSVVVRGTVYKMEPDAGRAEVALWKRGVAQLRRLIPETATSADPVPFRSVVFGIHIDSMTGRSSSSKQPRSRSTP
jgi:nitroimidazol reductase NimA-like FMN-containing flavoprotein (pyridoxamine 5'-phosphate oxidase superfamily)